MWTHAPIVEATDLRLIKNACYWVINTIEAKFIFLISLNKNVLGSKLSDQGTGELAGSFGAIVNPMEPVIEAKAGERPFGLPAEENGGTSTYIYIYIHI